MSISSVLKILMRRRIFWTLIFLKFGWIGTLMALQGLWLGPYLMNVYHLSKQDAGNIIMFVAFGAIIGCPLVGFIADRIAVPKKKLVIVGISGTILTLIPLIFFIDTIPLNLMKTLMFIFGIFGYSSVLIWPYLKENIDISIFSTASGFINFSGFLGGAVFQQLMGTIIARAPVVDNYIATEGFKSAFLLCFVYLIITLLIFILQREPNNNLHPSLPINIKEC